MKTGFGGIDMKITILSVGKLKESYLKEGIKEYTKRLTRFAKIELLEVEDEMAPERLSEAEEILVKKKEGERLLKLIPDQAFKIALDLKGKTMTSELFAKQLAETALRGKSHLIFIIGGSLGLSEEVLNRADLRLKCSDFTFPHQLMRLILVEQIYRAFKINHGESYHK